VTYRIYIHLGFGAPILARRITADTEDAAMRMAADLGSRVLGLELSLRDWTGHVVGRYTPGPGPYEPVEPSKYSPCPHAQEDA